MQNISFSREPFSPSVYLEYPLSTRMTKSDRNVSISIRLKITNAGKCADTNGHNFSNTEIVQGFLQMCADKGLHFSTS